VLATAFTAAVTGEAAVAASFFGDWTGIRLLGYGLLLSAGILAVFLPLLFRTSPVPPAWYRKKRNPEAESEKFREALLSARTGAGLILSCRVDGIENTAAEMGEVYAENAVRDAEQILRNAFRPGDFVARIGTAEFGVILENCSSETAESVRERIARNLFRYGTTNPNHRLDLAVGTCTFGPEVMPDKAWELARKNQVHDGPTPGALNQILEAILAPVPLREHAERTEDLSDRFARHLGLSSGTRADLRLLARLHDVGRLALPDECGLLEPEPWNDPDKAAEHALIGSRIVMQGLRIARVAGWIRHHHERFDGTGAPDGISGTTIPYECRFLSVVDAFVTLTEPRADGQPGMPLLQAAGLIREKSGTWFDPVLAESFGEFITSMEPGKQPS
jgi:GGDEF domain-containing protein